MPAVVLLFVGLYAGAVFYNHERMVPRGVETVQDFYRRYGNPAHIESLQSSGRLYYRVLGEIALPLGLPMGQPAYVFDGTGRLIDWTNTSRDDAEFVSRWNSVPAQPVAAGSFLAKFPPN